MVDWIKCSEKLPPSAGYWHAKYYLIFTDMIFFAYWCNNKWIDKCDGPYNEYHPTHWMPLPEKPNESLGK